MQLAFPRILVVGYLMSVFCVCSFADGMEPGVPVHDGTSSSSAQQIAPSKGEVKKAPVRKVGKNTNTKPLSDYELVKYQYCGEDKDCVIAINGCCDCANGGVEVAVNKERLEDFKSRFACLHVKCGSNSPEPLCENGVVSCISHRCVYYDERPTQKF